MSNNTEEAVALAIHAVEFEPGDNEAAATMADPALHAFRIAQARAAIAAMPSRTEVLEEAARAIEAITDDWSYYDDCAVAFRQCAATIRVLATKEKGNG